LGEKGVEESMVRSDIEEGQGRGRGLEMEGNPQEQAGKVQWGMFPSLF
jgi:hypothetical protein